VVFSADLKQTLERLYAGRSQAHLANDPLSFCHRFELPADREVAALISALFAYGAVKVIKGSLARIFDKLGPSPAAFVDNFNPGADRGLFAGFKHRFNDENDLCALLWAIGEMRRGEGSIEQFFCRFHQPEAEDVEPALIGFTAAVLGLDYGRLLQAGGRPPGRYYPFLFPSPVAGSACKRLCMFLRWVVRPADGIDLGLWHSVKPSQLIIPVDRHIERIGQLLGLTSRKNPDWRMAREITASLRQLDSSDPVKYDFSLCHLGISEGCNGTRGKSCEDCPVKAYCEAGKG
jgi:uncharacterized protein (TIGR02757 family)